ncbi:peptidoglycan editing factor PgeF [Methylophilus methylotrophus]|uniref:peptidoglycan editing factor PgeF n=1 Tax=Methylophilus methylotrophus TaxID=17 RepID=UPI000F5B7121|nr:peptidoglycan editing factor PgeF [Methylophilus methylotrophus]
MMAELTLITPDWPAPANVKALQTTRQGGVSMGVYASLNLGDHVKDNPQHVAANRQLLSAYLPTEPVWLNQVHGVRVIDAALSSCLESADASVATRKQVVCVTMTADCLPVLLCDHAGTVVAAVHAGWRSLCDGVIEATVAAMPVPADQLMAWLGPAIGPEAFEVGSEVRAQFMAKDAQAESAFKAKGDKWLGDLYTIARQRLQRLGVTQVYGGGHCTFSESETFFSFRRDGDTGRMGSFIWLE